MKLAKKISKGIALCAALTILGAMGGVVTSCSNGSDDSDPIGGEGGNDNGSSSPVEKVISNVDEVTFAVKTASVGAENTNIVFTYERSANGAKEKITIKGCNIEILVNGTKKTTITELDFALNEYDDFVGDKATQYQCKKSIGTKVSSGDTVKVVFKSKKGKVSGEGANSAQIDTLTVSLIDNDEAVKWYKELVENKNEYQPLFPKTDEPPANPNPVTPPTKEEIVFDFTKTETVKDKNDKDVVKLDKVTYCSADPSKFSAEGGLTLEVSASWDGAFKISTESLNLSNKNCIIEYKIDDGWTYTTTDGKKCLIQLISEEDSNYKATELSQGEFANDPAETSSWKTATIDNIYANNWDAEKGADLTKIIAIKINTTDGKGTIHIKSIKFVDK